MSAKKIKINRLQASYIHQEHIDVFVNETKKVELIAIYLEPAADTASNGIREQDIKNGLTYYTFQLEQGE